MLQPIFLNIICDDGRLFKGSEELLREDGNLGFEQVPHSNVCGDMLLGV